jgi:hypothetical protein
MVVMTAKATMLLIVSPRMVRDALVRVMREIGYGRVRTRPRPGERFDAAIVMGELPTGVTAHVVLTLPSGRLGPSWRVGVLIDGQRRPVRTVDGLRGLIALLDEYFPRPRSRSSALAELSADPRLRRSS